MTNIQTRTNGPLFSKRHYEALAETLSNSLRPVLSEEAYLHVAIVLKTMLEDDNKAFDPDRFYDAMGL